MPATLTAKSLREKRFKLVSDARKLNDEHADKDSGALPQERQVEFDRMIDQAQEWEKQARRLESLERAEASMDERIGQELPTDDVQIAPGRDGAREGLTIAVRCGTRAGRPVYRQEPVGVRGQNAYRLAFNSFLKTGTAALTHEQYAALQSDDSEQAGYLVASEEFAAGLLKEVDDMLFVRRFATVHTVREAGSLGIRKRTGRMNTFNWSAELQVSTADTALKFGKKVLTPHHMTGEILISRDLLKRSMLGVEGIVTEEMARDAGETMEDGYFTGDGAQKPLGVFVASADGISTARDVSTDNTTTAITADGLINAKFAMKAQYRVPTGERSGARWLYHRDAIKMIAKLKDGEGQYLWRFSLLESEPDRLLGYPVDESERAPNTFTTGQYVGLLAQWRYYEIADALDLEIQRLDELHSRTNQVGYIGRLKTDGMPTLEEAFVRVKLP